MPIYEYNCRKCSAAFEELIFSEKEAASVKCPSCGSRQVEKALSSFAVGSAQVQKCESGACSSMPSRACGSCPCATE